jgi:hypothetical protein
VRFELEQRYAAPVEGVIRTFTDPAFYEELAALPKVGQPEVLHREVDGDDAHLEVRMQFTGDLNAAVKAVIDPAKLSWIEVSEHDLRTGEVRFVLQPEHYADRFTCSGRYTLADDNTGGTVRTVTGELKVRVLLVRDQVERAIVSGLREHLEREAPVVEKFATR